MSKERARKFCELCHEYAERIERLDPEGTYNNRLIKNQHLLLRDYATSQAMQALEECRNKQQKRTNVRRACQECDYKDPRIAQALEEENKSVHK